MIVITVSNNTINHWITLRFTILNTCCKLGTNKITIIRNVDTARLPISKLLLPERLPRRPARAVFEILVLEGLFHLILIKYYLIN